MLNERYCYCPKNGKPHPDYLIKQGVPEGFCGMCERCGQPGHARHFPGPVPYTGAWCDRCYDIVGNRYALRSCASKLVFLLLIGGCIYFVFFS